MKKEVQNMENFYKENFKPKYFCHYDLQRGNLMQKNDKIFIIDFDHANYGYRNYAQILKNY